MGKQNKREFWIYPHKDLDEGIFYAKSKGDGYFTIHCREVDPTEKTYQDGIKDAAEALRSAYAYLFMLSNAEQGKSVLNRVQWSDWLCEHFKIREK
jgi:hypothetical protein